MLKDYHTLVLVPDICHTVYVRILTLYMIAGEKIIPVSIQDGESFIYLFRSFEFLHDLLGPVFLITFKASHLSSFGFSQ